MQRPETPAAVLTELYLAGVAAAAPGPVLIEALSAQPLRPPPQKVWIVAVGKAAGAMAGAAVGHLAGLGTVPAGGVVITPEPADVPTGLRPLTGDHPIPGQGSAAAADALDWLAARTQAGDEAWVLLSGGATSLAAAPVPDLKAGDLQSLYRALLNSGLDISRMNTVRKRFSRWGAGRLALALYPARVRAFVISDVIGDDIAVIGSGPCVPDQTRAHEVRELLDAAGLWDEMPEAVDRHLRRVEEDPRLETPKSGHPAFETTEWEIIAGNRLSVQAAARRAAELGLRPQALGEPVAGEAARAGIDLAQRLVEQPGGTCLVAGGETVVSMAGGTGGLGGRCQELALAAAAELAAAPDTAASLLAAGTDGRDGPTDAAGAIVDGRTWQKIWDQGRDPGADLKHHDAYRALDGVGALLRTGLTGTNVMDLMIGLAPFPAPR